MRLLSLALIVALSFSCASKYRRGVDYDRQELGGVISVEFLWWKAQQSCQLTILHYSQNPPFGAQGQPVPRQITIDHVHPSLCGQKVK